ncbi:MAG: Zn-ribbon domain-containing OB-fold protein [Nitrososphaerales archaeon]
MSERVSSFPGHEISTAALDSGELIVTQFEADLKYAWASGVAISRFLKELKHGRIIARKCNRCNRIMVPPRMFCEDCFRDTNEWVYVKDTGTINTYSIAHVGTDASRLPNPLYVAVINIDGASPMMGFLHLLGEVQSELKVGMKVQAVWKLEAERTGSILDIKYFKPI